MADAQNTITNKHCGFCSLP